MPKKIVETYNPKRFSEDAEFVLKAVREISSLLNSDPYASKDQIRTIWKSCENAFASKSGMRDVIKQLQKLAEKAGKIDEVVKAVNDLAKRVEYSMTHSSIVTITSAQMLALNATPVELIPAPGAGKYIEIKRTEFFLDYGSAAYVVDAAEDLSIQYATSGEIFKVETAGFLDQASDQRRCAHHGDLHLVGENEGITLKMLSGEILAGDSPLKVKVDYRVVEVLS